MEWKRRSVGLSFLAIALVASCAYQGAKFDFQNIQLIRQDVTTQDEAFKLFGAPLEVRRIRDGADVYLVWFYRYVPAKGEGAVLKVLFDDKGIVHSYEYKIIHEQ
jgi:hypothetical protein